MNSCHRSTILLFALALVAAPRAADEFFVKIEGSKMGVLKGETMVKGRETWTPVRSFGYQVTSPTDPGTGTATGRTQYGVVSFAKDWGAASPQLFQAISTNEILKSVVFEFTQMDGKTGMPEVFYRVTLSNARVTSFRQALALDDLRPLDSVTFAYQSILVESVTGNTSAVGEIRDIAARSASSAFGLSYSVDKGSFRVELPEAEVELRFLDLNGSLVKSMSARGGEVRFDARTLGVQPGMYLLQASIAGNPLGTVPVTIAK